jgi:glycosyltransferase involved in cell wall biosynthesis
MTDTAILTMEPIALGGVPSMARVVYHMLEGWGHRPMLVYARNAGPRAGRLERLRFALGMWRPAPRPYPPPDPFEGLKTRVVAAPPVPLWACYAVPQFVFGRLLGRFKRHIAVCGSNHLALPLALRGLPFVVWAATVYEDELQSKAALGDEWAQATLDSAGWRLLERQERFVYRRASAILGLSFHTADLICAKYPEVADKVDVALFPIDTGLFAPALDGRPAAGRIGRFLLLTARVNDPRKNVALLLEAFARVRPFHPDLKLVTVGDAPGDDLVRRCRALGISDAVVFIEAMPREALLRYYQAAELFVMSSVQEGLGISMLEAIACGLPVVTTDCGGPSGVVVEGQTGLIVPNNDAEALAEGILRLLADSDALEALRARCVEFARRNFARPVIEQKFAAAFARAYGESPPGGPA